MGGGGVHACVPEPSPLPRYLQASESASWLQVDPESGRVEAHQRVPPRSTFLGGWYVTLILAVDSGEWGRREGEGASSARGLLGGTQPCSKLLLADFMGSGRVLRQAGPGVPFGQPWVREKPTHPLVPSPSAWELPLGQLP